MPVYEYRALDRGGKNRKGIIDADSALAARQKLRSAGVFPVEVREATAMPADQSSRAVSISPLFNRVKQGELAVATRQLSILLGAGVNLVSSLEALIEQLSNPTLKKIMAQVKESVNEGNSLAHSLSRYPKVFSNVYINMVRAGEASGSLELVLERLAEYSEHQQALRNRFKAALAYPAFMFFVGTVILFFLVTFIVPNITKIFNEMHQTLPLPTIILIGISNFLRSSWWLVLAAIGGMILLLRRFKKSKRGRYVWDELKIRVPLLGPIHGKMAIARFGRTLGSLLRSGVPLIQSLQIVRNIVNNVLIAHVIDGAIEEIQGGKGLAAPLSRSRFFPPVAKQMIAIGEKSGKLEGMLDRIGEIYEKEVETRVMALTSMLEPAMILVMGVVIGFIVVSILLPIFEMNQLVR
ncbi:MAG: type II secretion system inner membrane protein GspF [Deltaproteobacteria bacterium]|nr:type II secretion system inner membrane protein GspF [Deltaproteobacteria bacterium]MBW2065386.1 type II secretion system inner membrane protein GspF [Deltaproteobacteria bacterium]